MLVRHSIRLTIQLTIDQHYRRARQIDNFLYKGAVASAASAIWEDSWRRVRSWLLSLTRAGKTRNINWSIGSSSRTWVCRTQRKTKSSSRQTAHLLINTQPPVRFTCRKNRTGKVFPARAIFQRGNLMPDLSAAVIAQQTFLRGSRLQIQNAAIQLKLRAVSVMPTKPAEQWTPSFLPATARSSIEAKAKGRSAGRILHWQSSKCVSY